jgi:hypothetical protein
MLQSTQRGCLRHNQVEYRFAAHNARADCRDLRYSGDARICRRLIKCSTAKANATTDP